MLAIWRRQDVLISKSSKQPRRPLPQRVSQALVHAGGVLADATLSNQTPSLVRAAMAGKLMGAQHLQCAAVAHPTTHTVLFSSVAALLGSPGQASYAAANAGVDALAGHWRGTGLPAASLQWGPWAGAGMATRHGAVAARAAAMGLAMIAPAAALAALESAASMGAESPAVLVAAGFLWRDVHSWGHETGAQGTVIKPLFAALAADVPAEEPQPGRSTQTLRLQASEAVSRAAVQAQAAVSAALRGLLGDTVASDQPLMEAGLDSLGAASLACAMAVARLHSCMCTAH